MAVHILGKWMWDSESQGVCWLVVIMKLAQSRITWEESWSNGSAAVSAGLSMGMHMLGCLLIILVGLRRSQCTVGGIIPGFQALD